MSERKNLLTDYGLKVKVEILKLGKTQNWLIDEIKSKYPQLYVDSSIINKIITGQIQNGKVIDAINEILQFESKEVQ